MQAIVRPLRRGALRPHADKPPAAAGNPVPRPVDIAAFKCPQKRLLSCERAHLPRRDCVRILGILQMAGQLAQALRKILLRAAESGVTGLVIGALTGSARRPLHTLYTLRALDSLNALRTRRTLQRADILPDERVGVPQVNGVALRRADRIGVARSSRRVRRLQTVKVRIQPQHLEVASVRTGRTSSALRTRRPLNALHTLRTGRALRALGPLHALNTLRTADVDRRRRRLRVRQRKTQRAAAVDRRQPRLALFTANTLLAPVALVSLLPFFALSPDNGRYNSRAVFVAHAGVFKLQAAALRHGTALRIENQVSARPRRLPRLAVERDFDKAVVVHADGFDAVAADADIQRLLNRAIAFAELRGRAGIQQLVNDAVDRRHHLVVRAGVKHCLELIGRYAVGARRVGQVFDADLIAHDFFVR